MPGVQGSGAGGTTPTGREGKAGIEGRPQKDYDPITHLLEFSYTPAGPHRSNRGEFER